MKSLLTVLFCLSVCAIIGCNKNDERREARMKQKEVEALPVDLSSPIIDKAIRKRFLDRTREVTKGDLERVTFLDLDDSKISDVSALLGDLKNLKQLEKLILSDNKISDVSALKELKQLKELHLDKNRITDISALKELKHLEGLWLGDNQIKDVSALKGLTHLTKLSLADNEISDLSPLSGLKELESLVLYKNLIKDVSPLKELKWLKELSLFGNEISDVSPLKELKSLRELGLTSNEDITKAQIEELEEALPKCFIKSNPTKLSYEESAKFIEEKIRDELDKPTGELAETDLAKVTSLDLSNRTLLGDKISDVNYLKKLTQVELLYLRRNKISDVSPLKGLKELKTLDLEHNPDLTRAQIAELQKALPKCKIEHNAKK